MCNKIKNWIIKYSEINQSAVFTNFLATVAMYNGSGKNINLNTEFTLSNQLHEAFVNHHTI